MSISLGTPSDAIMLILPVISWQSLLNQEIECPISQLHRYRAVRPVCNPSIEILKKLLAKAIPMD